MPSIKNYTGLKSGYYNLQKSMSVEDVIKELQKGGTPEPQEVTLADLTIPEGYTFGTNCSNCWSTSR